jgi:hypothetical protein
MRQSRIYTKEILEVAVSQSLNFTQVCKALGKFPRGATYQLIKNRILDYGININHFLGQATHTGLRHTGKCKTSDPNIVLVDGYKYRAKTSKLRRSLITIGVIYECVICHINTWNGLPLVLHIDHIDGDWSNCKRDNLRFLCPNCHSQTETYSGKNK